MGIGFFVKHFDALFDSPRQIPAGVYPEHFGFAQYKLRRRTRTINN